MPTLLVIDDQREVREILRFILTAQGFTVVTADNGAAGLSLYDKQVVDGAIVDNQMPQLNGIDACCELRARAQQAGRDLPVWLMTGTCTSELRRLAVAAGAKGIFGKPFDFAKLDRELKDQLWRCALGAKAGPHPLILPPIA